MHLLNSLAQLVGYIVIIFIVLLIMAMLIKHSYIVIKKSFKMYKVLDKKQRSLYWLFIIFLTILTDELRYIWTGIETVYEEI